MLDTPCSEVMWRVLATHCIRQFPLHFPACASPFAITFQLESSYMDTRVSLWELTSTETCELNAFLTLFFGFLLCSSLDDGYSTTWVSDNQKYNCHALIRRDVKEGILELCGDICLSPPCSNGGRLWKMGFRVAGFLTQKRNRNLRTWRADAKLLHEFR